MPTRLRIFFLLLTACELKQPGGGTDVMPMTDASSSTGGAPTSVTDGGGASAATGIGGPSDGTSESTSTSSSSTSTSTSASTDEMSFIAMPDVPPGSMHCNPLDATPCPEGQKCSATADERLNNIIFLSEPTCLPILGDQKKGELCDLGEMPVDGLDDCADTLCFSAPLGYGEPGEPGICVEFCGTGYYPDPSQSFCDDPNDFCYQVGCQECGLTLCLPTCDPLAPNCPDGQVCLFSYSLREQGFMCQAPEEPLPGVGEPCDWTYKCTPDSWCVPFDEVATPCGDSEVCCTPLCDLDAPNTCPGGAMGEVCRPFFETPFDPADDPWGVQYNHLGYCALP